MSKTNQELGKPVFCIACKNQIFRVFVTETKFVFQCTECPWKIEVNAN